MSRKRKTFTEEQWASVKYMAMIHCTGEEIAGVMQLDYDTLNKNCKEKYGIPISEYIKQNNTNGKMSLRRAQWKAAENGNVTMMIWLGKQWLDQKDAHEVTLENHVDDTVRMMDEYFKSQDIEFDSQESD